MYTNFQLSSMNISVQRTRLYLEDVDRSWLGVLEDWVIFGIKFDIMNEYNISLNELYADLQLPSMIKS